MSASDEGRLDPKPSFNDVLTSEAMEVLELDDPVATDRARSPEGAVSPEIRRYTGSPRWDGIPHSSGRFDVMTSHMLNMSASAENEENQVARTLSGGLEDGNPMGQIEDALTDTADQKPVFAGSEMIEYLGTEDHDRLAGTLVYDRSTTRHVTLMSERDFYWQALQADSPISKEEADFVADHLNRNFFAVPFYWNEEEGLTHKPVSFIAEPGNDMKAEGLRNIRDRGHLFGEYNPEAGEVVADEQIFENGYAVTLDVPQDQNLTPSAYTEEGALKIELDGKTVYNSNDYSSLTDVKFDNLNDIVLTNNLDSKSVRNGTYEFLIF